VGDGSVPFGSDTHQGGSDSLLRFAYLNVTVSGYTAVTCQQFEIGGVGMRNVTGTASQHHDRHVQTERPLPTLPRTSRYRFHDHDEDQSFDDSRHTERDNVPDPDVEDEP
jgi:hypothetical protein